MKKFKNSFVVALTTLTVATIGINVIPTLLGESTIVAQAATVETIRAVNFNDTTAHTSSGNINVVPGADYTFDISATRSEIGTQGSLDFSVVGTDGTVFGSASFDGNTKGVNSTSIAVKIPANYSGKTVKVTRVYTQAASVTGLEKPSDQVWSAQTVNVSDPVLPVSKGTVDIYYVSVDADGKQTELQPHTSITGNVGDDYTTEAPATITVGNDVYELIDNTGNTTGKFTPETITVAYAYKLKTTVTPVTKGQVTVKYVDEKGNALASDKTLEGNIGEAYKTEAPNSITKDNKEYILTVTPKNAEGTYAADPATVTYVYKEKTSTVITGPTKKGTESTKKKAELVTKTLPKTGETNAVLPSILGTIVLVASAVVVFFKKRKA